MLCRRIKSGIYVIHNICNGKIYIGSAVDINRQWRQHRSDLRKGNHKNPHLQSSWNKYGKDAFEFEHIFKCCEALLIWHEQRVIDLYTKELGWEMLYNINPIAGSQLGMKRSSETRRKISEAQKRSPSLGFKGKKHTSITRAKMSRAQKERKRKPHSPETRAKMSKASKGKKKSPEHCTSMSRVRKGMKHSLETRRKMSESQKRKKHNPHTPEALVKMSKAKKGKPWTAARRKAQENRRRLNK